MVDFSKYQEAVTDSDRQPYCQVFTPSDDTEYFGIFIAEEEAETADFQPDENWVLDEKKFKTPEGGSVKRKGYLLKTSDEEGFNETMPCYMVVVRFGPPLVYQGSQIVGNMYDTSSGVRQLTPEGEKAEDKEQKLYYKANKLIVYFLNDKLAPLSEKPFQLKLRGAFRGAFSTNYIQFQEQFEKIFLEQAKQSGLFKGTKRLDIKYKALAVFKFKMAMRVAQEATQVCTVSKVYMPSSEDIGKKRKSSSNNVTYILCDISDVFVDLYGENAEFAKKIFEEFDSFASFGKFESQENADQEKQELIYSLIQKLGWSIEAAQEFLKNNYGKTSRKKLSATEINDCIKKLKEKLSYADQLYFSFKEAGMSDEDIETFCLEQGVTELEDLEDQFLIDQLNKKSPSESGSNVSNPNVDLDDIPF